MPVVFVPHGGGPWPFIRNPLGAPDELNELAGYLRSVRSLPKKPPRALLVVSGHWEEPVPTVMTSAHPPMLYDYYGFPPESYTVMWPAPGDPGLALRVQQLLAPLPVKLDESWGFDHGTWSVLTHVYPDADVPVVQLSINETRPAAFHFEVGKRLAPLRDEGVLIVGSGNLVHNLHTYAWGRHMPEPYDWAIRFEEAAREMMMAGEYQALIDYETLGRDAMLSIPTPDHYLPLLYVIAARQQGEAISFPVEGIDGGSISMLTVRVG